MDCLVYDCRNMNDRTYDRILCRLSDERRRLAESFVFFPDRVMSAVAGLAMESLAESLDTKVRKLPNGKPVFIRDDMHLSVSHSGGLVAIAWSDSPVGVDVQQGMPLSDLAYRILCPKDDVPDMSDETLLTLWSAKESYVKLTGEGMTLDFRDLHLYHKDGIRHSNPDLHFHTSRVCNGYALCICGHVKDFDMSKVRVTDRMV